MPCGTSSTPLVWLDLGAPGLAFGQFVGRWGNFINQELYGPPTGSDWFGLRINPDLPHQPLPPGTDYTTRFHPTFLYESLWCLVVFVILYNVHARLANRLRNGDVLLGYLILYPLGRFFIEIFRPDAWTMGGLATAQWIAVWSWWPSAVALPGPAPPLLEARRRKPRKRHLKSRSPAPRSAIGL